MADKPAEPKVYFKCLPKEQVFAFFDAFKKAFDATPKSEEKKNVEFEIKGTNEELKGISVETHFLEPIVNLGINPSDYHKIDAYFRSGFSPEDFFNLPIEELTLKAIQFALSFKSESVGIRRILTASIQALKGIKLTNDKFQKKLEEHIEQLNVINAFVSFAFNIEFDAKELHGQGLKAASEMLLKLLISMIFALL